MKALVLWFSILVLVVVSVFAERYFDLVRRISAANAAPASKAVTDPEILNRLDQIAFEIKRLKAAASTSSAVGTKELLEKIDELSSELYDFERTTQQNLITLNQNVIKRIADLSATVAPKKLDVDELKRQLEVFGAELDLANGRVSFKTRPIMRDRPLEVVAIIEGGPGHESLFRGGLTPSLLRLALIALGLQPGKGVESRRTPEPTGERLWLYVTWPGNEIPLRLEDCILDGRSGKPLSEPTWLFSASDFVLDFKTGRDVYIPDDTRVLVALTYNYSDSAVISCRHPDAGNEQIFAPNVDVFPETDDPEMTIIVAKAPVALWEAGRPTSRESK